MPEALPSWNDGATKQSILDFVTRVTKEGGRDYVPSAERIAAFDNDGTLWCEYPMQVQVFFALDQLEHLATLKPEMRITQPYKAFLEKDLKTIATFSKKDAFAPGFATHAGMTVEEFRATATEWFRQAKHPKFDRLFTQGAYQPQRELLDYLRANGFKTYIVTGGGVEFVRVIAEQLYGIPPEQVVGSSTKSKVELVDGKLVLRKVAELDSFDDRDEKVVNIGLHIGRHPILVVGNSDGDLAMLRYAKSGARPSLALLVHHDDAEREFAYDRDFRLSPLREALDKADDYGIQVVSMKGDWKTPFAKN